MLGLSFTQLCYSQQLANSRPLVYDKKELWFDEIVTLENTNLINGPEYFISFQGGATHPFFGLMESSSNELWFDQQYYGNVHLLYDTYTDILVLRQRDKNGLFVMIELEQDKIKGFTINQHHFIKLTNPKQFRGRTDNGYYDMLFEGNHIKLVAKRNKSQYKNDTNMRIEYQLDDHYYLIKNSQWIPIAGLRNILTALEENKNEIKAYIKTHKIRTRKIKESDLKLVVGFCDQFL